MAYNVDQALKDGVPEEEIAGYLSKTRNYRLDEAVKAGVPYREIINYLAPQRRIVPKSTHPEISPKPIIEKPSISPIRERSPMAIAPPGLINPNLMIPEARTQEKPSPVTPKIAPELPSQPKVDTLGFPKELIPSHEPVRPTIKQSIAEPPKDLGLRPDRTPKGLGFLGPLKRPDGGVSTEISVGVNINGQEIEIPSLVPTLDPAEKDYLLKTPLSPEIWESPIGQQIMAKAVEHAKGRMAEGKSPFAQEGEQPLLSEAGRTEQVALAEQAKAKAPQIGLPTKIPERRALEPLMQALGISKEGSTPIERAKASNLVALSEATGWKISPTQIEPVYEEVMEKIGFKQYPTPMELYPKLGIAAGILLSGGTSLALGAVRTGLGIVGFLGAKEAESLATQVLAGEKPKLLQGREAKEFLGPLKEPYATGAEVGEFILPVTVAGKIAWNVRNWFRKQPSVKQGEILKLLEDKMKGGQTPEDIAKEWTDPNIVEAQWKDVAGRPPKGKEVIEPLKPLSVGPPGLEPSPEPIGSTIPGGTPAVRPTMGIEGEPQLALPPGQGFQLRRPRPKGISKPEPPVETPEPIGTTMPMGFPIAPQPKPIEIPAPVTPIPPMMGMGQEMPAALPEERLPTSEETIAESEAKTAEVRKVAERFGQPQKATAVPEAPPEVVAQPLTEVLPVLEKPVISPTPEPQVGPQGEEPLKPGLPYEEWSKDPSLVEDARVAAENAGVEPEDLEYIGLQSFKPASNDAYHLWNVTNPESQLYKSTVAGPKVQREPILLLPEEEVSKKILPISKEGVKTGGKPLKPEEKPPGPEASKPKVTPGTKRTFNFGKLGPVDVVFPSDKDALIYGQYGKWEKALKEGRVPPSYTNNQLKESRAYREHVKEEAKKALRAGEEVFYPQSLKDFQVPKPKEALPFKEKETTEPVKLPDGWEIVIQPTWRKTPGWQAEVDWKDKRIVFETEADSKKVDVVNHEIGHIQLDEKLGDYEKLSDSPLLQTYAKIRKEPKDTHINFIREHLAMDYGTYLTNPEKVSPELKALFEEYFPKEGAEAVPPTAQHLELMPEEYPNIEAVAVKQDGKVYKDHTHINIVLENNLDPEKSIPGFVTKQGEFVEQYPKSMEDIYGKIEAIKNTPDINKTKQAHDLGKTLTRDQVKDVWEKYKERIKEPRPEKVSKEEGQEWLDRSFTDQMYRETVAGHLGEDEMSHAFTPQEIEKRLSEEVLAEERRPPEEYLPKNKKPMIRGKNIPGTAGFDIGQWLNEHGKILTKRNPRTGKLEFPGLDMTALSRREGANKAWGKYTPFAKAGSGKGYTFDVLFQELQAEGYTGTIDDALQQLQTRLTEGRPRPADFADFRRSIIESDPQLLRDETINDLTGSLDDEIMGWKEEMREQGISEKDIGRAVEEATRTYQAEGRPPDLETIKKALTKSETTPVVKELPTETAGEPTSQLAPQLKDFGYDDRQIARMRPDVSKEIVDKGLNADQVSITQDGYLVYITKKPKRPESYVEVAPIGPVSPPGISAETKKVTVPAPPPPGIIPIMPIPMEPGPEKTIAPEEIAIPLGQKEPLPKIKLSEFEATPEKFIPNDMVVDVKAIREKTGKEIIIKQNAREAFLDLSERLKRFEEFLECIRS